MTQEQNQSPCDHPEPCACFAEGNYVGRESAHRQLREWLPDDHERDCMCQPCRTAIAVLQAFQPGIIDYRDVATLYAERGGRQSDQTPYGDFNYDDRPAPRSALPGCSGSRTSTTPATGMPPTPSMAAGPS